MDDRIKALVEKLTVTREEENPPDAGEEIAGEVAESVATQDAKHHHGKLTAIAALLLLFLLLVEKH